MAGIEHVCVCERERERERERDCCVLLISRPVESRALHICKLWRRLWPVDTAESGGTGVPFPYLSHPGLRLSARATVGCNYGENVSNLGDGMSTALSGIRGTSPAYNTSSVYGEEYVGVFLFLSLNPAPDAGRATFSNNFIAVHATVFH